MKSPDRNEGGNHTGKPPGISLFETHIILDARTTNGRPLDEKQRSPKLRAVVQRAGIQTEMVPGHFADSRGNVQGAVKNNSALQEVLFGREEMLDSMAWLRAKVFSNVIMANSDMEHLHTLSAYLISMPSYLMLRAEERVTPDQVPDVVGNMFKAGQGIYEYALTRMENGETEASIDPEGIYTHADASGWLIHDQEVCAAPPGLIKQTLAALIHGEGGVPDRSNLNQLIPDFASFSSYTTAYHLKNEVVRVFGEAKVDFVSEVVRGGGVIDDDLVAAAKHHDQYQLSLVGMLNSVQTDFNHALGYDATTVPEITRRELDGWTADVLTEAFPDPEVPVLLGRVMQELREYKEMGTSLVETSDLEENAFEGVNYAPESEHDERSEPDPEIDQMDVDVHIVWTSQSLVEERDLEEL